MLRLKPFQASVLFSEAREAFAGGFFGLKTGGFGFGIAVPGPNGVGSVPNSAVG